MPDDFADAVDKMIQAAVGGPPSTGRRRAFEAAKDRLRLAMDEHVKAQLEQLVDLLRSAEEVREHVLRTTDGTPKAEP